MKINKIINLVIVFAMLVFSACEPIVDTDELSNNTTVDDVELIATQSSPGGNGITLKMATPGVTGYWDYNIGRAYSDEASFIYPIPGINTFTFTGTLGAEFFTKTIEVQVDVLDQPLDQDWYDLVSTDTSGGKTWVWDGTPGNGLFWYMSPPDAPDSWAAVWWNAADCCMPHGLGKLSFDLNGGANYTYYSDATTVDQAGSFSLDVANQTLSFSDTPVIGGDGGRLSPTDSYQIISLTEDELILYVPRTTAGDSGWTYIFRPE